MLVLRQRILSPMIMKVRYKFIKKVYYYCNLEHRLIASLKKETPSMKMATVYWELGLTLFLQKNG